MTPLSRPLRVAVVAPIMVRYDAISLAARDTVRAFSADPRFEVCHFGSACDFPEVAHRHCNDVAGLLLDPYYRSADVAVFHFGIHHSLFDALMAGGPPVRIVRFHNVTPACFVSPRDAPGIERSLRQIDVLRRADEIWADSPVNARDLLQRGFDATRLRVIPLAVDDPPLATLQEKPRDAVRILFVGRFAPSKGLHDLVEATARLPRGEVQVTLAGNVSWSDPAYLTRVRELIVRHGLEQAVHFTGTVSDAERERLFNEAHILAIPSYHEGFCRPVAEGLRAGCVPVVYDGYNLPYIAAELGRVVPAGNVEALAAALKQLAQAIRAEPAGALLPIDRGPTSVEDFTRLAGLHVAAFRFEAVSIAMKRRLLRLAAASLAGPRARGR